MAARGLPIRWAGRDRRGGLWLDRFLAGNRHGMRIAEAVRRGFRAGHRHAARRPAHKRKNPGDDLFSRKAALSVSSALESLTSVFGMGTGMASPLESPGFVASGRLFGSCRRAVVRPRGAPIDLRS